MQDALDIWAKNIATSDTYVNSTPEQQRQDKIDFFKKYVAPKAKNDLENHYLTFMLATKPTEELTKDENFLTLDEEGRKTLLKSNLAANGKQVHEAVRPPGVFEGIGNILQGNLSPKDISYSPEVEGAYLDQENSFGNLKQKAALVAHDIAAPGMKLGSLISSVVPGETAARINSRFNDVHAAREKLQSQHPEIKGLETASELVQATPAIGMVGKLGKAIGGVGGWLARGIGNAAVSAPMGIEAVDQGKDIQATNQRDAAISAVVGGGIGAAGDAAFSPAVRNMRSRIGSWFSKESDIGNRLATDIRKANPTWSDEQVLAEAQRASTDLATSNKSTMFTGAESGNRQLREMQSSVPGTNYSGEIFTQMESPNATLVNPIIQRAGVKELPQAQEYIATKLQPQSKAEFKIAQKNAVDTLTQTKTDFGNKLYNNARESGVLREQLGQSKNQFATELKDILKNPEFQKSGYISLKKGQIQSTIPSVTRALKGTNGPAQLTVDDATSMLRDLAGDLDSNNATVIKPVMEMVENKLSGSQSEGVARLRQTYAEFNKTVDETIDLTKQQFSASGAFDAKMAKQPIMKALTSGSSTNIGRAVKGELPDTEIPAIMQDVRLHKTTKAAIAADMADTLNPQNLGSDASKDVTVDLIKFADEYGSETAAKNVKALFQDDPGFITNFDKLRELSLEAKKLSESVSKAPNVSDSSILKQAAAGTVAQLTGIRGQLATASAGPLGILQKRSSQYIRESITDKAKAGKILDETIAAQKGRIKYKDLFDKYISKDIALGATQADNVINSNEKKSKFKPVPLTKEQKSGIIDSTGKTTTKIEPLAYQGSPFDVMQKEKTRSPFDVMNEQTPEGDVNLKKAARNVAAAGAMALATTGSPAKSPIPDLSPKQANYAAAVAGVESNFGKDKRAFDSYGAQGHGQFFGAAKKEVEERLGRKLNLNNAKDSLLAISTYADINKERLKGIKMTDGDLYAAHMLGAGTFKKLHEAADKRISAGTIVPPNAYRNAGNKSVFFDKEGKQYTPAQVLKVLRDKFNSKAKQAGGYLEDIRAENDVTPAQETPVQVASAEPITSIKEESTPLSDEHKAVVDTLGEDGHKVMEASPRAKAYKLVSKDTLSENPEVFFHNVSRNSKTKKTKLSDPKTVAEVISYIHKPVA